MSSEMHPERVEPGELYAGQAGLAAVPGFHVFLDDCIDAVGNYLNDGSDAAEWWWLVDTAKVRARTMLAESRWINPRQLAQEALGIALSIHGELDSITPEALDYA